MGNCCTSSPAALDPKLRYAPQAPQNPQNIAVIVSPNSAGAPSTALQLGRDGQLMFAGSPPQERNNSAIAITSPTAPPGTPGSARKPSAPRALGLPIAKRSYAGSSQTMLVAIYPYESRADGDLGFQKGDTMVLLDDR